VKEIFAACVVWRTQRLEEKTQQKEAYKYTVMPPAREDRDVTSRSTDVGDDTAGEDSAPESELLRNNVCTNRHLSVPFSDLIQRNRLAVNYRISS
jgi:hypothetical protein